MRAESTRHHSWLDVVRLGSHLGGALSHGLWTSGTVGAIGPFLPRRQRCCKDEAQGVDVLRCIWKDARVWSWARSSDESVVGKGVAGPPAAARSAPGSTTAVDAMFGGT